jgi:hypothetical protein
LTIIIGNSFLGKMNQQTQHRRVNAKKGIGYRISLSSVLLLLGLGARLPAQAQVLRSSPPLQLAQVDHATFQPEDTRWEQGIRWEKRYVVLGGDRFPVFSLEFAANNPRVALRPIWSNPHTMEGTSSIVDIGRQWGAFAAINAGFFNRNNRLPLGAVRRDGRWFSGPILNRGAIAWNDQGNIKIGRLTLQETLTASTGQRFFLSHLNSGYVQAGMARYTLDWGQSYRPITNNEIIIYVENNQVTEHYAGGAAGQTAFPLPQNGYILVIRAGSVSRDQLPPGTTVSLTSTTNPSDFGNYPNIVGAGPLLLQGGRVVLNPAAEKFSTAFAQQSASRSLIGTTSRGTIMLAVVHNRQQGRGPSLGELATLAQRMGMTEALNLDGGSSSSLYLGGHLVDRPPAGAARVHNGIGVYLP